MDYLEEVNPDVKHAGVLRRKVLSDVAHYEQLLYEKRREATEVTLDAFFWRVSLPEASASDEPPNNNEPPASGDPQSSTSTGEFTHTNVSSPSPSLSDIDDPHIV